MNTQGQGASSVYRTPTEDWHHRVRQGRTVTGCYVDSVHGQHMWKPMLDIAKHFGYEVDAIILKPSSIDDDKEAIEEQLESYPEILDDLETHINEYMNDECPLSNASWGRNWNSDWGLWECDVDA